MIAKIDGSGFRDGYNMVVASVHQSVNVFHQRDITTAISGVMLRSNQFCLAAEEFCSKCHIELTGSIVSVYDVVIPEKLFKSEKIKGRVHFLAVKEVNGDA